MSQHESFSRHRRLGMIVVLVGIVVLLLSIVAWRVAAQDSKTPDATSRAATTAASQRSPGAPDVRVSGDGTAVGREPSTSASAPAPAAGLLAQANEVLRQRSSPGGDFCPATEVLASSDGWLAVKAVCSGSDGGVGYVIFKTVNGRMAWFDSGTAFQVSDFTGTGVPAAVQAAVTGTTVAQVLQQQGAASITVVGLNSFAEDGMDPNAQASLQAALISYFADNQLDGQAVSSLTVTNVDQTIPDPTTGFTTFTATLTFNGHDNMARTIHVGIDLNETIQSISLTEAGGETITIPNS